MVVLTYLAVYLRLDNWINGWRTKAMKELDWDSDFPGSWTVRDFVKWLDKNVDGPSLTTEALGTEQGRIGMSHQAGRRDLVDDLVHWLNK